jgi:hypothetical protein
MKHTIGVEDGYLIRQSPSRNRSHIRIANAAIGISPDESEGSRALESWRLYDWSAEVAEDFLKAFSAML